MTDLHLVESKITEGAFASTEVRDAIISAKDIVAWAEMALRTKCAITLRLPTKSIPSLGYALNTSRTPFDLIFNVDEPFSYIVLNKAASPGYFWRLSGFLKEAA